MSTLNIQLHDKYTCNNISLNICFLEQSEESRRDSKTSSNSHDDRTISVRVIDVLL